MIPSGRFISVSSTKVSIVCTCIYFGSLIDDSFISCLGQAKTCCFSIGAVFVFYKPTAATFITPFATLSLKHEDTDKAMQAIQDSMYFHNPTTVNNI